MFASRSEVSVRSWTHPWIAAVSFFFLMAAALLVHAPSALGQSTAKHRSRAAADTVPRATSDEGISVRVIDGGKTTTKRVRVTHETTKGEETVDEPDKPDVPEPPSPRSRRTMTTISSASARTSRSRPAR